MTKLHQGYERLNKEIIYWINQSAEIDLDRDNRVWTEKNKKELYEEFWKISNSINNDCFHDISKMDDKSYISAITDVMTELGSVYLEFYPKSAKIKFNAVPDHDDTLGKILNYSKYKLDSDYIRDMSHNYTKSKLVARYPIRQFLLCNFLALIYDNTKHKFSYLTKLFYNPIWGLFLNIIFYIIFGLIFFYIWIFVSKNIPYISNVSWWILSILFSLFSLSIFYTVITFPFRAIRFYKNKGIFDKRVSDLLLCLLHLDHHLNDPHAFHKHLLNISSAELVVPNEILALVQEYAVIQDRMGHKSAS